MKNLKDKLQKELGNAQAQGEVEKKARELAETQLHEKLQELAWIQQELLDSLGMQVWIQQEL